MIVKTVVIYDSQYLTRKGLVSLVEESSEFDLLFETHSIRLLKDKLYEQSSDISIVNESNISVIREFLLDENIKPKLEVILIIKQKNSSKAKELTELGVKSILTEYCDEHEIKSALQAVSNGKRFFCDRILDAMLDVGKNQTGSGVDGLLSTREKEVLELIVKGNSTAKIAENLFVSIHTINTHRKNILKKLNLKSPTQLILYAIENGIIKIGND